MLVLLIIRLHSKGLEGNTRDVIIKKNINWFLNKTLALEAKDCHSRMSWSPPFLISLMLQQDIPNLLNQLLPHIVAYVGWKFKHT
jgi:hypothetical protein